jgi:predicted MPP superfamily phosphohydrolase
MTGRLKPLLSTVALSALASAAVAVNARYRLPYCPVLERVSIPVPAGHEGLAGSRIGFITDTHVGPFMTPDDLQRAVSMIAAEGPDLVLLGGDYVSESPRYAAPAAKVLGELVPVAPLGCLAVLGNHDISADQAKVTSALEAVGIRVLRNEAVMISAPGGPLWIAGVDETVLGRPDVAKTFAPITAGAAVIALWHGPDHAPRAAAHGAFAQLSGHTHGGQVRLPGIGPVVLPAGGRRYPAGGYEVDGMRLYVARGAGVYRPAVRLNCPPEVTIVSLTTNG